MNRAEGIVFSQELFLPFHQGACLIGIIFLDNFQPPVLISQGFLTVAIEERQFDVKQHGHPHYFGDTPTPGIGLVPAGL